ncbi:hypothetical protein MS3_00000053 [Schistosoma haematobium]|uniref:Uncharacterized protein n=1 Tax=Schistosoma haematobium TaxID=6185 RepID=A0A922LJH7_SCHHA|nr:hypothetical protein MS3_00000053 [Schistosoma haematobium]KAH9587233.1 hypothetical protein MS3_00000053 [Schistosoma haematobium]
MISTSLGEYWLVILLFKHKYTVLALPSCSGVDLPSYRFSYPEQPQSNIYCLLVAFRSNAFMEVVREMEKKLIKRNISKQTCTIDDFNLIKQILNQYFISEYMWINIK